MVQFLFTNKDMESLKGLYRIMTNGFVSVQESVFIPSVFHMLWPSPPGLCCSVSSQTLGGVSGLTARLQQNKHIKHVLA